MNWMYPLQQAAGSHSNSAMASAQTDEIQVYDAAIAARGVFNLTWHNNYVANGIRGQPFPGAVARPLST